jgi:NitT/TauT family transport system substrate-binding protein
MIKNHRAVVQQLVNGIAQSGKWLDESMDHRMQASQFVAINYFNQNPRLLAFVLSKPPDRVKYTNLTLHREDFAEIERLGLESGIFKGTAHFDDYCDTSFAANDAGIKAWDWEAKK